MKSPLSFLVIECYGGAAGRIANDATAYPHRNLPWDILFGAQWTDPLETPMHREWARSGEEMLRPFSANAHLASALDIESEEVIDTAFGANLPRLRAIKQRYDPTNFFRVNYNIKPASAQAGAAQAESVSNFVTNTTAMRRRPCRRFRRVGGMVMSDMANRRKFLRQSSMLLVASQMRCSPGSERAAD